MGVTYFYLADSSLLVSGYWGLIDPPDSEQMRKARAEDPGRKVARWHLIDLTLLKGTDAPVRTEAQIYRSLARRYAEIFGPLRTVIIAESEHVFGLARIFETVASLQVPPVPVQIARNWAQAEQLMALDLGAARKELTARREGKD